MYIRTRNQSITHLSEMLQPEQLQKITADEYTDVTLSVISDFSKQYAADVVNSKYSALSLNKLADACVKDIINHDDLHNIAYYSEFNINNEIYIDDFLKSIENGVYNKTAIKTFIAVDYEDCSYKKALDYVNSKAFYPTQNASLSLINKVAE